MPGLVGFIGNNDHLPSENLLNNMAWALESDDLFRAEFYNETKMGFARVSLDIVNSQPQPVWNAHKTMCLIMEGEIFNIDALKEGLAARGRNVEINSLPEILLKLYEEFGEDCAIQLNGSFVVAIWDKLNEKLVVFNDRFGLYPLYYASHNGRLLFASGVRALLVDDKLPREIDRVGLAEFLTFDHLLDDRTLLKSVRLLPQASILTYSNDHVAIRNYWSCKFPEYYPVQPVSDLVDELLHITEQAVRRQAHDDLALGVLLSGGLDSRVILAYLTRSANVQPVHAFTWGIPGCDDARFAKEVSKIMAANYHFFELKPDWLLHKAKEAVRITDGMGNVVNLHAIATVEEESKYANILFKGFLGDAIMGYGLTHHLFADYDSPSKFNAHISAHKELGCITFPIEEHNLLFTEPFQKGVLAELTDDYLNGMERSGSSLLADQRNYFDLTQRVPRMTIKGVEVARSRTMVRLPFADNDLVEFSLKIPPGLRYKRYLMKNAFIRAYPNLAQVPITETGLPMTACSRDVLIRANRIIRWHLQTRGFDRFLNHPKRSYKNYNLWFRTVLRSWVEEILLSKQAVEREYYNYDYIRQILDEHMAGKNYSVKLGALISIELWHREFID